MEGREDVKLNKTYKSKVHVKLMHIIIKYNNNLNLISSEPKTY